LPGIGTRFGGNISCLQMTDMEAALVGIVIVSHSHELAVGVCELARQMTGGQPVPIVPAGGTDDGRIGTSLEKVSQALKTVFAQAEDVLVLADLGSAVMITQMACESLPPEQRAHVSLSDAPFVEGAIAAAVAAAGGGDIMTVKQAAEGAQGISKIPSEGPTTNPIPWEKNKKLGKIKGTLLSVSLASYEFLYPLLRYVVWDLHGWMFECVG